MKQEEMRSFMVLPLLLICLVAPALGGVLLSSLKSSLIVSASPNKDQVLAAGEDVIKVTWGLNQSLPTGADAAFKTVKLRLCYAPESQKDRGWRKANDDLKKDKTCQFDITKQPYTKVSNSFEYKIERSIPTATYFVRAYVLDSSDTEVAFGQTTGANKTANYFQITGVSGRSTSLDIAAACFSAFSVLSLAVFFVAEKRKKDK